MIYKVLIKSHKLQLLYVTTIIIGGFTKVLALNLCLINLSTCCVHHVNLYTPVHEKTMQAYAHKTYTHS